MPPHTLSPRSPIYVVAHFLGKDEVAVDVTDYVIAIDLVEWRIAGINLLVVCPEGCW